MAGQAQHAASDPRRPGAASQLRAALVVCAVGLSAAVLAPSTVSTRPLSFQFTALLVGWTMIVSGLATWESVPGKRMGSVLVVAGCLWLAGRLQDVQAWPVAFAAALANVVSQVAVLGVLLAFPTGRIGSRIGRAILLLALAAAVGSVLLYASLTPSRQPPAVGPNPAYLPMDPTLRAVLQTVFEVASYVLIFATLAWMIRRWRLATPPARRSFTPIFVAALAVGPIVVILDLQ